MEAKLCDLLHKLPSEIEAEDEIKVFQLVTYFAAKHLFEQEQAEQRRLSSETQMGG